MSACKSKLQGLFAEDALTKLYFEQKSLVTWYRQITKSSMRSVNQETITDALSLFKILPFNGFNSIRAKQRLLRRRKRVNGKFFESSQKPKVIDIDNSLEFGKSCKDLSWNHRTSTPHRSETNGIAERDVRRVKEGTSAVLQQSGLDEKWWVVSMECFCYLRKIQDLVADGKTPYERRFGEHLDGPMILFGPMVEYFPILTRDIWQESIAWNLSCMWIDRGGIWKGAILITVWRFWKRWMYQKFILEESTREKYW